MSKDVFGPPNALGGTAARPARRATLEDGKNWFKSCSKPGANDGTEVSRDWFNSHTGNARELVLTSGISPTADDDDLFAQAAARYASGGVFYQDSSATANAFVLAGTADFVMPKSYFVGMTCQFVAANTNSGPSTVNVSGIGVKNVRDETGAALAGGEIVAGQQVTLFYSGSALILPNWSNALKIGGSGADGVGIATINGNAPDQDGNIDLDLAHITDYVSKANGGTFGGRVSAPLTHSEGTLKIKPRDVTTDDGSGQNIQAHYNSKESRLYFYRDGGVELELYIWNLVNDNLKVLHEGDYGHGKGIDADMLDGHHATDFVLKSNRYKKSPWIAIVAGRTIWAHLQGATPTAIDCYARCEVAELGYSVGDIIKLSSSNKDPLGYQIGANSTEIWLSNYTLITTTKGGGASFAQLNRAKWKIQFIGEWE